MEQETICKKINLTPQEARQKAEDLFAQGYNCAQSVAAVFSEELGISQKTMLRLAQPFGAGMGRMREVCGAVSGMVFTIGLLFSNRENTAENKIKTYEIVRLLCDEFSKKTGSLICAELLNGVGLKAEVGGAPENRT